MMRRIVYFTISILFVSSLISCKKDVIELPDSNEPVFKLNGTVGTQAIDLVAGDDGAYMYTNTDLENGVRVFSGNLSAENFGVEIGLYDGNIDQDGVSPLSVIDQSDEWAFNSNQDLVILSKDMFPNHQLIDQVQWSLNGSVAGIDEVIIDEPGKYNVCAFVTFDDGTSQNLCNELIVGYYRNSNCRIRHYINQNGQLTVWLDKIQGSVEEINWYIDGELVGKNTEYSGVVTSAIHHVTAEVSFANGVHREKSLIVDGTLSGKFIDDFTVFEQCNQNTIHRDYNWRINVVLDGITYSSLEADNSNSTISISNVEYYGKNSSNQNVYRIDAVIDAKVRATNGSVDVPVSFTTSFGLEIPE